MQDFVKLAKWEDRGHYAQKQEAEKSQRQLHKMVRDSQEVLKRPAGGVIGGVSASMGFADVVADAEVDIAEYKAAHKKRHDSRPESPADWQEQVGLLILYTYYGHCFAKTACRCSNHEIVISRKV